MPNGTDDLFTVTESLPISADAIGVERNTVEGWRYTAHNGGKSGASRGGVHRSPHPGLGRRREERRAAIEASH